MIEINKKRLCESCFREIDNDICPYCGFSAAEYSADPLVLPMGTRLNDKMIIGRVMGKGGFGITYLGYDLRMDKIIAVKEYYPNGIAYRAPTGADVLPADEKSAEAFENGAQKFYTEAEMVAQFNGNPNIVSVYDYFRANNTVYLVMEYLRGLTLKNYVKKHGKLTDGQALFVIDKIAAALSITHSAGVLHRDISPDNIMLCMDGKVKLIDFGAARQIMAESSSNLTVVMKPGYTPIEQYTKKGRQGAWTDIYSLGVSIYYALTGVIVDDPYARIDEDGEFSENKHGINQDLWEILKKCTMINASDRYGSAIDLRKALRTVSAPIKSEPIALSEDDLKEDNDTDAPVTDKSENECPVTAGAPAGKIDEEIEVFENETASVPANDPEPVPFSSDKETSKKKFIIAGICAAVVVVIGVVVGIIAGSRHSIGTVSGSDSSASQTSGTVSGSGNSMIESSPNSDTEGDLVPAISISKSQLDGYNGDIRVTLKTRYNDTFRDPDDGNYYHCIGILADDEDEKDFDVNALSLTRDENNFLPVIEDGMDFVFVIPQELRGQITDRVSIRLSNIAVDSIVLEEDTYDKVIEFDDEYPGDWELAGFIPKSELERFNSDVRICYDLDVKLLSNEKYVFIYFADPMTTSGEKIPVSADNLIREDEGYGFGKEGKTQFAFTISREEIAKLPEEGLAVRVRNAVPLSVSLKGLSETVKKPLYIPLGTENPGEWQFDDSHIISKDILEQFAGDIKVVLDIETADIFKNGNDEYWHSLTVADGRDMAISVDVPNTGCSPDNDYGTNGDKFTFILPKDEVQSIYNCVKFAAQNIIIHGATLYDYDPGEYKISPDAKLITLTSDVDKWGENYVLNPPFCPSIPKKDLESLGGDVKVTLTIEQVKKPDNYDGDLEQYDCFIAPYSGGHFVIISSDNAYIYDECMRLINVKNVPNTFTFVIPKSEIAKLNDNEGLSLHCRNLLISQAALEKVSGSSGNTSTPNTPASGNSSSSTALSGRPASSSTVSGTSSSSAPAVIEKPLHITLGTEDPGKWQFDNSHTISKDILEQFGGDIKIVLDIETVRKYTIDGGYGHCVQIADSREEAINVNVPNIGCDVSKNYYINDGAAKFTFILPKDEIPGIYKEIKFAAENTVIHGATLYDYDPDEYKISPDAKVITLKSDVDKLDDRYAVCPPNCPNIPKKEFESFGGDVKVTLSMKQLREPNKYEENLEPYDCFIQTWCKDHFVIINADNAFVTDRGNILLNVKDVPETFTFVISKSEIAKLDDEYGLDLICRNLLITSAALEKA